jgi:hypothetical protein
VIENADADADSTATTAPARDAMWEDVSPGHMA